MKPKKGAFSFEVLSGILLFIAAALAMIIANSPLFYLYDRLLDIPVEIRIGTFEIDKPLLLWINDGLMAIFFFLIGLEIKREVVAGELSNPARIILPVIAAAGGMVMPALIYTALNHDNGIALQGWAIPMATDIAFALGVIALLGTRVPTALKLFLMTLAIVDDLGAIIVIALFYTTNLSLGSLLVAAASLVALFLLNRRGILSLAPYLLVGLILWIAVLKSGVHATLAGVLTALFIPHKKAPGEAKTKLEIMEHDLQPAVAYGILPLFAFANTGVSLAGITLGSLLNPVPLGIALGLFFGNQFGVFGFSWIAIKLGVTKLPSGASWGQLWGVSMLCGIGFTMSLFISALAFENYGNTSTSFDRLGILLGSLVSGICGYMLLRYLSKSPETPGMNK